jgi:histidine triad (HIT) family protein
MGDCVFCRIAKGEIPCSKVYEDDRVLAFMDINPVTHGHTLVIPKAHSAAISEVSADDVSALGAALRRIAPAVMKAAGAEGYNILNNFGTAAGQAVEHVHFHIIPRKAGDGRGYRWLTFSYREGEAERLAADISRHIR